MKYTYLTLPMLKRLGSGAMLVFGITLSGGAQYCTTGLYLNGCIYDGINDFTPVRASLLIRKAGTGCSGGVNGYAAYRSINPGISFSYATTYGCCEGLAIWTGFNDHYRFNAPGLMYTGSTTIGRISSTIAIPAGILPGRQRMHEGRAWLMAGRAIGASASYWAVQASADHYRRYIYTTDIPHPAPGIYDVAVIPDGETTHLKAIGR